MKSLDQQIEHGKELAGLKPIFFRLEEIAKQNVNDFDVQLAVGDIKQHLVNRGDKLKEMKDVKPSPATPGGLTWLIGTSLAAAAAGGPYSAARAAMPPTERAAGVPPPFRRLRVFRRPHDRFAASVGGTSQPPRHRTRRRRGTRAAHAPPPAPPPRRRIPPNAAGSWATTENAPGRRKPPVTRTTLPPPPKPQVKPVPRPAARKTAYADPPTAVEAAGDLGRGWSVGAAVVIGVVVHKRHQKAAALAAAVQVEIATTPPGASVRVNGEAQCTSNCSVALAPGNYQITAFLDGYEPAGERSRGGPGAACVTSI